MPNRHESVIKMWLNNSNQIDSQFKRKETLHWEWFLFLTTSFFSILSLISNLMIIIIILAYKKLPNSCLKDTVHSRQTQAEINRDWLLSRQSQCKKSIDSLSRGISFFKKSFLKNCAFSLDLQICVDLTRIQLNWVSSFLILTLAFFCKDGHSNDKQSQFEVQTEKGQKQDAKKNTIESWRIVWLSCLLMLDISVETIIRCWIRFRASCACHWRWWSTLCLRLPLLTPYHYIDN